MNPKIVVSEEIKKKLDKMKNYPKETYDGVLHRDLKIKNQEGKNDVSHIARF